MEDHFQPIHRRPVKLVLVHGTGAGDPENISGERWWQLDSAFHNALGERINLDPAHVEIVPFQWEVGPNSEKDRRAAAANLLELLASFENAGVPYYLIGHSHGGSVIYNTLLQSVDQARRLTLLQHWITIGTPFLDYRMNRFMYQRLTGMGLTIYSTGLIALFMALAYWVFRTTGNFDVRAYVQDWGLTPAMVENAVAMDFDLLLHNFAIALTIYAGICLCVLFFLERRKRGWFTKAEKRQVEDWYGDQWLGLWHQEDEAISALTNVKRISGSIIPSTFLSPVVTYIQLGLIALIGVLVVWDIVFADGHLFSTMALEIGGPSTSLDEETGVYEEFEGDEHWAFLTFMILFILSMIGALVWLATLMLKAVARMIGWPLSIVLNKIIWSSVRQRAWGDDLPKEDVRDIAPQPPEFQRSMPCLPEAVAAPLRDHSDGHAISTLNKVRMMLGMAEGGVIQPDVRAELGEALNWQELIHTSYFEVPAFVDLLAMHLIRLGLGPSRDGFQTDRSSRQELIDWLDEQAAVAGHGAGDLTALASAEATNS